MKTGCPFRSEAPWLQMSVPLCALGLQTNRVSQTRLLQALSLRVRTAPQTVKRSGGLELNRANGPPPESSPGVWDALRVLVATGADSRLQDLSASLSSSKLNWVNSVWETLCPKTVCFLLKYSPCCHFCLTLDPVLIRHQNPHVLAG